jgi:hypothetical protein
MIEKRRAAKKWDSFVDHRKTEDIIIT